MDRPSMLDGLHWKLLGNGLATALGPEPLPQSLLVSRTVPRGIWLSVAIAPVISDPVPKTSTPAGKRTPFARTVIPAPSYAPISDGSCNSSRSEEHTSELQSQSNLVCRLLLEKKKN